MKIDVSTPPTQNPIANFIPTGMVFSGSFDDPSPLWMSSLGTGPLNRVVVGLFLKLPTHIVDLNTYALYGCGIHGRPRIIRDYKPHPQALLFPDPSDAVQQLSGLGC